MTPLLARRGPDLDERLEAFRDALALADGRLPPDVVAHARAVDAKAAERLARGAAAIVVALGGGTGSGKSSLFNALAGARLSAVGARRPVTSEVVAWAVGEEDAADRLLDWLGVAQRHHDEPSADRPEGLVLLDLPDHDSVETAHREVVDRFVERVDVLVWVVDPLKYAQRALHDRYLRRLAEHAKVLLVVLNRVDQLQPVDRPRVLTDLRRLLETDGLGRAQVLATSAVTGEGVEELRDVLRRYVAEGRAVAERIAADVRTAAAALAAHTGPRAAQELEGASVAAALADAVGARGRAERAARAYAVEARAATRPLFTRLFVALAALLRRPFRGLRPPPARVGPAGAHPSSIDTRHALLALVERAAGGLPDPWPLRLHECAQAAGEALPRAVVKAVDHLSPWPSARRRWWLAVRLVWSLVELALAAGVAWLAVLAVLAWLRLPDPPLPEWRELPWPTLLTVGGGVVWLFTWLVRGRLIAAGAARHARAYRARLRSVIGEVAAEGAVAPLARELDAHDRLAQAAARAAA